jgi:hypothetical protein
VVEITLLHNLEPQAPQQQQQQQQIFDPLDNEVPPANR